MISRCTTTESHRGTNYEANYKVNYEQEGDCNLQYIWWGECNISPHLRKKLRPPLKANLILKELKNSFKSFKNSSNLILLLWASFIHCSLTFFTISSRPLINSCICTGIFLMVLFQLFFFYYCLLK